MYEMFVKHKSTRQSYVFFEKSNVEELYWGYGTFLLRIDRYLVQI